jgi:hypothetical protein
MLACPFWKHDFIKHGDCSRSKLNKISRVKQHIARKHTPSFYCECCLVVFPDAVSHTTHVRHKTCKWDPLTNLNGISHQQHRELTRKSNHSLSESDKWFSIWDIIFPAKPRPASAYIDPDLSEDFCRFREFTQNRGSQVLIDELRASGFPAFSDEAVRSDLQRVLDPGLNRLHEEWLSTYLSKARSAISNSVSSRQTPNDASSGSLADSGVSWGSQSRSNGHEGECSPSRPRSKNTSQQGVLAGQQAFIQPEATEIPASVTADVPPSYFDETFMQTTMGADGYGDSFGAPGFVSDMLLNDPSWADAAVDGTDFENIYRGIQDA